MVFKLKRGSYAYSAAKWGYQPIVAAKHLAFEISNKRKLQTFLGEFEKADFRPWQIGCGPFPKEGWLNTDIPPNNHMDAAIDITKPIAIPENFLDIIYGSEVIEHIKLDAARLFFREAVRVLKPGGVLRMTTPDMERISKKFLERHDTDFFEKVETIWLAGEFSPEIWVNAMFRYWGHEFIYSKEAITRELEAAGFTNIVEAPPQKTLSKYPQLNKLDRHQDGAPEDESWLFGGTLIIEAEKPT